MDAAALTSSQVCQTISGQKEKILLHEIDELLAVQEAAGVLGVGVQRMYNLRNLDQGPVSYRRGRRLVYPRSGLAAFLARNCKKA